MAKAHNHISVGFLSLEKRTVADISIVDDRYPNNTASSSSTAEQPSFAVSA